MFKLILKFIKDKLFKNISNLDNLDSPDTNESHKKIIQSNYLLKNFYIDCYQIFKKELIKEGIFNSKILEIGSGSGFIKKIIPNTITSEIIDLKDIDLKVDGTKLPFDNNYLDAIILLNVLHHISDPKTFLVECERVLKKKGIILLIEPANTFFSRIIYKNFHHEEFNEFSNWYLKKGGRLTVANQAIPYIIFERDLKIFNNFFTNLSLVKIFKFKPLHYLLSGGLSYEPRINNNFLLLLIKFFEKILTPINNFIGLFMFIKIKKKK